MSKYILKDDELYTAGTLAQLLDIRNVAVTEPDANTLPKTINPLKFLFNNLLLNNSFLVLIDQRAMNTTNEYLKLLNSINYVTAPESCVLAILKLNDIVDKVEIQDDTNDNIAIAQDVYIVSDSIVNNIHEDITISYNQRVCQ